MARFSCLRRSSLCRPGGVSSSAFRKVSFFLLLLTVILAYSQAIFFSSLVSSNECTTVEDETIWKHSAGVFRRYAPPHSDQFLRKLREENSDNTNNNKIIWVEFGKEGQPVAYYGEVLRDTSEGIAVLLDLSKDREILLRRDLCGSRAVGAAEFQQLYEGSFMKTAHCD